MFISYARGDAALARRVAKALQADGHAVWWDALLPAHRSYSEEIEQKLHKATAVVVLWSNHSTGSQWVRAEADLARSEHKLVQALLDSTTPPLPFNQIQCADLSNWRGNRKHAGWRKLADSVAALGDGDQKPSAMAGPKRRMEWPRLPLLAALGTALMVAAAFLLWPRLHSESDPRLVVAVLPFTATAVADQALVAGMWEDTRQALSRNPNLTVLGPNSSQTLANDENKQALRAVDYLLEASVRTDGQMIRVSTSLVRAKDGVQIWSQIFDRRLEDVFKLQTHIAQEIEGRIRGRLARGGGVLPEHISTSSDVYALYSEARRKLRQRSPAAVSDAKIMLRQVVVKDPNFAPGWASLAVAERLSPADNPSSIGLNSDSQTFARKAIALAPNLAAGHSALALTLNLQGPIAERALRKAIELDPNNVESISWLATMLGQQGEEDAAFQLLSRAVEIEPLWSGAVLNRVNWLIERKQERAIARELARLERLGSKLLWTAASMEIARAKADISEVARLGLEFYRDASAEEREFIGFHVHASLVQLGYPEQAFKLSGLPPFALPAWKNDPKAIDMVEALEFPPRRFWAAPVMPLVHNRMRMNHGRANDVLRDYRAVGNSPESLETAIGSLGAFVDAAPTVALALERTGHVEQAAQLIAAAEKAQSKIVRNSVAYRHVSLARIRAMQGRKREGMQLLSKAFSDGWRPEIPNYLPDLALDPPLATLQSEKGFDRIRTAILAHFAKERAELGRISID